MGDLPYFDLRREISLFGRPISLFIIEPYLVDNVHWHNVLLDASHKEESLYPVWLVLGERGSFPL
jgi:hypothetical protein